MKWETMVVKVSEKIVLYSNGMENPSTSLVKAIRFGFVCNEIRFSDWFFVFGLFWTIGGGRDVFSVLVAPYPLSPHFPFPPPAVESGVLVVSGHSVDETRGSGSFVLPNWMVGFVDEKFAQQLRFVEMLLDVV
ncbi:hypothetical protein Tco_0045329 [Tanacetum coccineum]